MRGGVSSDTTNTATTSQISNVACSALPTWLEGTKSRICVGMTIVSSAAISALRGNHNKLRISSFVCESRETFTFSPHHPYCFLCSAFSTDLFEKEGKDWGHWGTPANPVRGVPLDPLSLTDLLILLQQTFLGKRERIGDTP